MPPSSRTDLMKQHRKDSASLYEATEIVVLPYSIGVVARLEYPGCQVVGMEYPEQRNSPSLISGLNRGS